MAIAQPKAMEVSQDRPSRPLKAKYRVGMDYKNQKARIRTNASTGVHKGDRWKTVRAAARRGTFGLASHLK